MTHRSAIAGQGGQSGDPLTAFDAVFACLIRAYAGAIVGTVTIDADATLEASGRDITGYGLVRSSENIDAPENVATLLWIGTVNNTAPSTWSAVYGYGITGGIRYTSIRNRVQISTPTLKELTSNALLSDGVAAHVWQLWPPNNCRYCRSDGASIVYTVSALTDDNPFAMAAGTCGGWLYAGYAATARAIGIAPTILSDEQIIAVSAAALS